MSGDGKSPDAPADDRSGESLAIERSDEPVTVSSVVADLRAMGVEAGDALLVHSSLSALGWVSGGAPAVVDALQEAVTEDGTLVMPTHSFQLSDPSAWSNPPVPDEWEPVIRDTAPPYRPAVTPTRGMGAVPECFRNYPGVQRSAHPTGSFAAWGASAESVVADHSLAYCFGDESPLARCYALDADVLMLGTGYGTNTSLHLAENRSDAVSETVTEGAPVLEDGERRWVEFENVAEDTDDFPEIGADFEREIGVVDGTVGEATAKLVSQPRLVDFAVDWLDQHR